MKVLIKSAELIEPGNSTGKKLNLLIEDGLIKRITDKDEKADRVISGSDILVSAGWVDMNAGMGDPGLEHKEDIESFVSSAAAGGFTEVVCLPNTKPVIQTKDIIAYIKCKSEKLAAEIHPIAALTLNNKGEELSEMIDLHEAGAIAFSDGVNPIWHSDILLKSLQYTQKFNGLVIQRPEDRFLSAYGQMNEGKISTQLGLKGIPAISEEIVVMRDLKILEYTGGKLHFSLISTLGALTLIKEAKKKGLQVTCDVAAYMLALDDSNLTSFDTNYKVNPPLRDKKQVEGFRKAVKEGVIDVIVSGHRPHEIESKELEFDHADFGIISLQNSFVITNTFSDLSNLDLVTRICFKPREILNLPIPLIKEDAIANLTVFERNSDFVLEKRNILSKSKNTPFIGMKMKGKVLATFNQKKIISMNSKPQISIVVPLLNEEESLPELCDWIERVMTANSFTYELLLIDDGSTDNSWEVIGEICQRISNVRGLRFNRNYGKSAALHVGFREVLGDVVITMDADLQDSPDEIPALYNMIVNEKYDLVSGWKKKRYDPLSKTIPTKLYNYVTGKMSGVKLHDMNCGLKAYKASVVKHVELYGQLHRYIPVIAKWNGYNKIGEKVVQHQARKYGYTKFGLERFIFGPLDLLSIIFVSKYKKRPMHFFGSLGIVSFLIGFGITVLLIGEKLYSIYFSNQAIVRDITEKPLFYIALVAIIVGVQLFLAGFLGEMMTMNSDKKSDYIVSERIGC